MNTRDKNTVNMAVLRKIDNDAIRKRMHDINVQLDKISKKTQEALKDFNTMVIEMSVKIRNEMGKKYGDYISVYPATPSIYIEKTEEQKTLYDESNKLYDELYELEKEDNKEHGKLVRIFSNGFLANMY